jgi:hypothetical protein
MKIKGLKHQIRLNTKWANYNCGVRMAGRLHLEVLTTNPAGVEEWKNASSTGEYHTILAAVQHNTEGQIELIKEFINNLQSGDAQFITPLHGPDATHVNPIFESDGGRYVPTVILVADQVHIASRAFPHWCHLIKLAQEVPELGLEVHPGITFNNSVYGFSPHASTVWQIVLPMKRQFVLANGKIKFTQKDLKDFGYTPETVPPKHWKEIEACVGATRTSPSGDKAYG